MPDETRISLGADIAPLHDALDSASQALSEFASGPVSEAGARIEAVIGKSFDSIGRTISRAAVSGKLSIDDMVNSIVNNLQRIAINQFISKPLENIFSSMASSLFSLGGARAAGGPVSANIPYLVGELGPEIFVPASSGAIAPNAALAAPRSQIVLNVQARDAHSFVKSEPQLAAMMSRALARGQRNL